MILWQGQVNEGNMKRKETGRTRNWVALWDSRDVLRKDDSQAAISRINRHLEAHFRYVQF
jgi:hypothetical protein